MPHIFLKTCKQQTMQLCKFKHTQNCSYHVALHLADMETDLETCGSTGLRVGLKCSTKAVYFVHQKLRVLAPVSRPNLNESRVQSSPGSRYCIYLI